MKNKKKRKGLHKSPKAGKMKCPYCGSQSVLQSADGIYRENNKNIRLFVCSKYPECDAYVRVQDGTKDVPLGSMANGELRALRRETHKHFDKLYKSGLMSKQDAYSWLSTILAAPMSYAHIGQLGDYYCKVVIEESKKYLENNRTVYFQRKSYRSPAIYTTGGEEYGGK